MTNKRGRPMKGQDESGNPVSVKKEFTVVSVRVSPERKRQIEAAAFISGQGVNEFLRDAIDTYFSLLPANQLQAIEQAAKQANSIKFTPSMKPKN